MKTTASKNVVLAAIDQINKDHGYQIRIKDDRNEPQSKWQYHFTITSNSKIPGARISGSGRNIAAASWHAHGYLFDEILSLDNGARIKSAFSDVYRDKTGLTVGNWQDISVGSFMYPMMMSETSIL